MNVPSRSTRKFETFGGESNFDVVFYVGGKISLRYGGINENGRRNGYKTLESGYLERMAAHFSGRLVPPSATGANAESIDQWIRESGIQTRLSSYVCTLLVEMGFAKRENDHLRFL